MKKIINTIKNKLNLDPNVIKLGFVSFFADIASEMLYPLTPFFLVQILGSSMLGLGLIEGLAEFIASIVKLSSGRLSDNMTQRKPLIAFGYFISALSKPMIGVSHSILGASLFRYFDRFGKGIRTAPRDALLSDSIQDSQRGFAFGFHRGMDSLGAALGPMITLFLLNVYAIPIKKIYQLSLIPGLISVFILLKLKDKNEDKSNFSNSEKRYDKIKLVKNSLSIKFLKTVFLNLGWQELSKKFKYFLFIMMIFSLVNSSDMFLLLKAHSCGLSINLILIIYCIYNLIYAILSPVFGKFSDKIPRKYILSLGFIVFSMVYFGFAMAQSQIHVWILFCVYGIYMAATDGVSKALAVDLLPKNLKGSGLGLLSAATGFCGIIASSTAGILWDKISPSAAFLYGASGALISGLLILLIQLNESKVIRLRSFKAGM